MPNDASAVHESSIPKGLVSAKLDEFRKSPATSRKSPSPYPPAFPRARFERVQTPGDWPAHNADLYNQPHPRTMTLAPSSGLERATPSQHQHQQHTMQEDPQVKSAPSHNLGVTGLKHLWESKGRSDDTFTALQCRSATSSWDGKHAGDDRLRTFAGILTTRHDPPRKASLPESHRVHHLRRETEDLYGGPQITNGSSNGSSKAEGHRFETSLDTDEPNTPAPQDAGRSTNRVLSLPDRKEPSMSSDRSYHPDVRPIPRAVAPAPEIARKSMLMKPNRTRKRTESRFVLNAQAFKEEHGSCNPSSDETATSTTEYHSMDQVEPASTARTQDNHGRNERGSVARPVPILEHDMLDPVAPNLSSTLDAATQTDSPDEHDLAETSSVWSESELEAERSRHHMSHHRTSKPIRLEQRMRRQAVRQVQVIVSFDGATEVVMDARLRRKRGERIGG
ncbi:MAG: hypothetical protein Q9186_001792 [Xanthomendoza sp. 1 TL-2023]